MIPSFSFSRINEVFLDIIFMTEQLVAVQRNHFGEIISFQTSSGRVISYRKARKEVEDGIIGGAFINEEQNGTFILAPTVETTTFNEYPVF